MQFSEENPELARGNRKSDDPKGVTVGPAHALASDELDEKIKKLTFLIEARFHLREPLVHEFAHLRLLLKLQLAKAQALADVLPVSYLPPAAPVPIV
jgi:hypothetical protein